MPVKLGQLAKALPARIYFGSLLQVTFRSCTLPSEVPRPGLELELADAYCPIDDKVW